MTDDKRFGLGKQLAKMQTEINPKFMENLAKSRGVEVSRLMFMLENGSVYTDWDEIKKLTNQH